MPIPVSVIVLTYNEEKNIRSCLESVKNWTEQIYVVDSYSTDNTLSIVREYTSHIFQHPFENYSKQRNWALENLPINTEWILNLDADHRVTTGLRDMLIDKLTGFVPEDLKGFMASRRTMFMGRWIKRGGHYPVYHAIMFRKGWGFCEDREYDQHFVIRGKAEALKADVIDIITDSLTSFTTRHNRWATLEATEAMETQLKDSNTVVKPNKGGNLMEQRRWLRMRYYRSPIFLRVFLYFGYRYFFKLGFLEGKEGLIFHFLQGFWFRLLVDAKIYEAQRNLKNETNESQPIQ
jgi:glycosyltransferase involved in cell wall biosynthesis